MQILFRNRLCVPRFAVVFALCCAFGLTNAHSLLAKNSDDSQRTVHTASDANVGRKPYPKNTCGTNVDAHSKDADLETSNSKDEETLIRPGVGIGPAKLGLTAKHLQQSVGKFDAAYTLPNGTKVERADWKEHEHVTPVLRVFYGADGKAIQIATAGAEPATASGINRKSSHHDVETVYPKLTLTEYRAKNGRVDYFDAVSDGIAFEFCRLDGDLRRSLYQIIVHKPGVPVMPDIDERSLR